MSPVIGRATVILFNRSPSKAVMSVSLAELKAAFGFNGTKVTVHNLWAHSSAMLAGDEYSTEVEPHAAVHVNIDPL